MLGINSLDGGILVEAIIRVIVNYGFVPIVPVLLSAVFTQIIYNKRFDIKSAIIYAFTAAAITGIILNLSNQILINIPSSIEVSVKNTLTSIILAAKTILTFMTFIILLKVVLKLNYSKSVIALGIFYIILAVGNATAYLFVSYVKLEILKTKSDISQTLLIHSIINSVVVFILFIIKSFKLFSVLPVEIKSKAYRTNIIYIAFTFIIIGTSTIYWFSFSRYVDNIYFLINIFLTLGFLIFNIVNTNTLFKLETTSHELDYQVFYNKSLESVMDNLRRVKHNYNNMLAVLGGYIKTKKWNELERYFNEICEETNTVSTLHDIMSLNIKNVGILGLISTKIDAAKSKGVNIRVINNDEVNEVNMKVSELCEVLGILFDNAIEAAFESESKVVEVVIKNNMGVVSFAVENSINREVDLNRIFQQGYSNKGNDRGLGLWITGKIIKKYNNVILNTFSDGRRFKQELIIQ